MKSAKGTFKNLYALRFEPGEDVMLGLQKFCEDHGIGHGVILSAIGSLQGCSFFDPEELPRLFQRFYRGKNAGENNFGIGLSLSRQVLAQQNGTVQAENVRTGGARFILRWYKGTI